MKKPRLKDYSSKILFSLARNYKDEEFSLLVREILEDKLFLEMDYKDIYVSYKKSSGLERLCYGDAIIQHQEICGHFIEPEILDEVLDNTTLDHLWFLSNDGENPMVKQNAYIRVVNEIDKSIEERKKERRREKIKVKSMECGG